ncbi:excitatory amino acid transporter-like [Mercenaria mercenaria]|uniref:excitatory amino acid transporter-like n=1 Tax=Mercenaria mercenaria TaxID=6596 RepID=UPI001E1D6EFF|nr:excitatory amino acid transporter-like [Mercenaria mercenaria]XP_045199440.1 excitatory amino acid transporter-like [Mercenaria mercenaria]XP_045199441.1 excitatory amino acid transporter-like [Mercenaria mercenaria]
MVKKASLYFTIRRNLLLLLTLLGVLFGIGIGFAVRSCSPSSNALLWLGLPGQLYLRLLKMMIVPLIVSSVITGTASLDPKANGKISMVAFVFVFITNMIGTILGVLAFYAFRPGVESGNANILNTADTKPTETQDIFADMLRNIIPDNLFEATFQQTLTKYKYERNLANITNTTAGNVSLSIIEKTIGKTDGPNLLGLIFACTLFGMAASTLGAKGKPLIDVLEALTQTVIVIIRWLLWTTPFGVFSLILVPVASLENVGNVFRDLGMFIAAVVVACVIQQLLVMPLVLFITTRRNPYKHLSAISRPWLIAFAASSTAVAIPEMLTSCEVHLTIDKRIARFTIPLSVTISANGSAVFIACSCLFLSSISGMPTTAATLLTIGFLTTMSALAIPSVPSASIVTIVMILSSLNVSLDAIALLLAVDFFLDRVRTTSSVVSHTMCAAVTHHLCKDRLTDLETIDEGDVELTIEQQENLLAEKHLSGKKENIELTDAY